MHNLVAISLLCLVLNVLVLDVLDLKKALVEPFDLVVIAIMRVAIAVFAAFTAIDIVLKSRRR